MCSTETATEEDREPRLTEIRVKGHIDAHRWANRFEGLTITLEENGDTLITGPVTDQAALYGLLRAVRNLGLQLLSINPVEPDQQTAKSEYDSAIQTNSEIMK